MDGERSEPTSDPTKPSASKPPVVRGARACTVCRAAKMKCVGAEDGQKQCQRCKRANVECVFEKHRRGRKPGSKLSEASKMLRRLEKGLNTAKLKSQSVESAVASYTLSDSRAGSLNSGHSGMFRSVDQYSSSAHFQSNELPPLNLPYQSGHTYSTSSNGSRSMDVDDENDDGDQHEEGLYPAKLIRKENQRHSFFRTVLGPEDENSANITSPQSIKDDSFPTPLRPAPIPTGLNDPITAGIITEEDAKILFDAIYLRLNPFVNLFDPALHSVDYVRSKCPFLFTTLITAGCKFFKPEHFKACQKLANDFAARAFTEAWKRVEVVQAFACLTYWKDPDDNRTWTYIGYACRMAVEIGLNRYVNPAPAHETEFQKRERRNRERTYLVLFVHDRSLSMQTGRLWMLPEDDVIRNSENWHTGGGPKPRPEDVVVAAFVQLRRIAAQTTDIFGSTRTIRPNNSDLGLEVVLRNCNSKLTKWSETWEGEMQRASGEKFHFSILQFFRLHVRLFLNSFSIQANRASPNLQALSACYSSALETLQIVYKDFASMSMLCYCQDSITVMTAYSAVFLLRLLRTSNALFDLHDDPAHEIHTSITKTVDAYFDASTLSPASTSAVYHARFLRNIVANNDIFKSKWVEPERSDGISIDPRLQVKPGVKSSGQMPSHSPPQVYTQPITQQNDQAFQFPASPHLPALPEPSSHGYPTDPSVRHQNYVPSYQNPSMPASQQGTELDAHYWRNMFLELGFGEGIESSTASHHDGVHNGPSYYGNHSNNQNISDALHYHTLHPNTHPGYGH